MPKEICASPSSPYLLDDEQRRRVRDCLTKEGLILSSDRVEGLMGAIEQSMALFISLSPGDTFRQAHDRLIQLWEMSHHNDPKTGVIRGRIQCLPKSAVDYLDRRWPRISSTLFPDERSTQTFQDWAQTASAAKLIQALHVITAEGAKVTEGRSRGPGAPLPESRRWSWGRHADPGA
jgi:hypothetical protein